ncbi:BRO-N domain-containing protein [Moraxella sp. ZY200743]|uniref:BRO-N domain-containing protein n=1 Tax=Moraxella sp. ZY200743 TaxID=2911970 RepID=UPI003D7E757F
MNNQISTFIYETLTVRTATNNQDGSIWFCLPDVANVLEIQNSRDIVAKQLDKAGVEKIYISHESGKKLATFINEPNLYRVIFRSNKAEAVKFQNWVFDEVLPSIRKTGSYQTPTPKSTAHDRTPLRQAVTALCGKLGIMHPEAYALVHQYMGVSSIDEIAIEDLPKAVAYVHSLMMGGVPRLNIPFIQNVLTDALYQNRKAQTELNDIRTIVKGLLHHLEDTQDYLARNERNVLALRQRFIA